MKFYITVASAVVLALMGWNISIAANQHGYTSQSRGYGDRPLSIERGSEHRYQVSYSNKTSKKRRSSSSVRYHGTKRAFPNQIRAPGVRTFIFSPRAKAWGAYSPSGRLVGYGRASGGANWCRDIGRSCRTPRGTFRVMRKGSPSCRSSRYPLPRGGARMPYCMFYSKYYAIHGSYNVPNYNASHGCIRVTPKAARWLSNNFITIGTKVVVTSY